MARPTKYTTEVVDKIIRALESGAVIEIACMYAGIGERTFYDWLEAKPQFSQAVKRAESAGAMTWLQCIDRAAADGQWQAAAWKLERRYPQHYGRRVEQVSVESTSHSTEVIEVVYRHEDPLAARAARAALGPGEDPRGA